ncbi:MULTISPECIES: biotin/lipoyl-binding protein [unclassified Ensifer]|uniref:HlyD family secretion protein n=1 Tax=unclassified Ensifer TaxID=2633371 RepID=UPI0008132FB9|nr:MULTISPECIES: biotin/lipoyl-binding protein [unclassified Ensifer]OCP01750.1 secretion protein HlyD [Ensifer sp. LC14]OCP09539.1 secretion protein HlyD [Ensifer sp. LC13]OCP10710.1 secretion protein HlyD [Ensifer sp. LC11]OCP32787.1 secretion protein HlyD [Ensifer sp. LC499]
MFEFMLCSMLTILPDYLFRRYVQGKRLGREITLYSVWFELRWGITACIILTISLITLIFYFHPSTKSVTSVFRTVAVLPETGGRVAEIYVKLNDKVVAGQPLFRLDNTEEEAAAEVARRQIAEVDAEMTVARTELTAADGAIVQAQAAVQQAQDEYDTQVELNRLNPNVVARREIERRQVNLEGRKGALTAVLSNKQTLETKIASLLPSQRSSAEAALQQAEADLAKTTVRAGVSGTLHQFTLRVGEVVNPMLRPAGVLVPEEAGRTALIAGFGQIEAQVMKVGMIAEATCIGKPFTIIPMVVTEVQDVIAGGQIRASDQLVDVAQLAKPGTLTVFLEPLYPGLLEGIPPGSSCIANAYTNSHDELSSPNISTARWLYLHVVDAVGLVHAMILRMQALMLPVQTLVLGGH